MDLDQLIDKTVVGLGYEMVECERSGRSGLLRIFVDKPGGITVDDCARISQHLAHVLAVEGVDYGRLEISSPGLDRILRKESDFMRFIGQTLRVKMRQPVDGRRNFVGDLRGVHEGILEMEVDGATFRFELGELDKARLVPNL